MLSDMQQMMVDDGLPLSCIMTQTERDAAWTKNPPRAMPAQKGPAPNMSLEDRRVYWSYQLDILRAKDRAGQSVLKDILEAENELEKCGGDISLAKPAMAAVRATVAAKPIATPRPAASAPVGQTPPSRRVESAMAGASIVRGIDNGGLVTADDLSKEFGVPAKFIRYLLRTHKPVPKPAYGWSFDENTVDIVRNFLRTKTNTTNKAEPAVSRERSHAPAKETKPSKPAREKRGRVRPAKSKSKKRR